MVMFSSFKLSALFLTLLLGTATASGQDAQHAQDLPAPKSDETASQETTPNTSQSQATQELEKRQDTDGGLTEDADSFFKQIEKDAESGELDSGCIAPEDVA